MNTLTCSVSTATLHRLLSRCAIAGCNSLGLPSRADSGPSTSGRSHADYTPPAYFSVPRSYSASASETTTPTPTTGSSRAASAAAPSSSSSSPQPAPPASSPSSSPVPHPFYAGLARTYPDPDSIPEALLHRLRAELFGRPVQLREKTGRRALARPLQGRQLADWYFLPPKEVPGFHNEEREYEASKALNRRHTKGKKGDEAAEAEGAKPAAGKKKK